MWGLANIGIYTDILATSNSSLLNLSIIGAVKVNAVDLDLVSVPSDTTVSGLELRVSDTVEAHGVVEASVCLAESDGQVGDFCIEILRQFKRSVKWILRKNALYPSREPQLPAPV